MDTDLEKIKRLDEKDIAGSKAQDFSSLLALWDDEGVALPPEGNPIVGMDALREWLRGEGEPGYKITEYEHDFLERKVIGDWAFEWGIYKSCAIPLEKGDPIKASGKLLRILKRQPDGEWKVARAIWNIDPGT